MGTVNMVLFLFITQGGLEEMLALLGLREMNSQNRLKMQQKQHELHKRHSEDSGMSWKLHSENRKHGQKQHGQHKRHRIELKLIGMMHRLKLQQHRLKLQQHRKLFV